MKIVADENISFAEEAFGRCGNVLLSHGRQISNKLLNDTDILIVRSITKVDKTLLDGTPVRFVGTATIGTDHIDKDYLSNEGIHFADAAGCNSNAVKEYVLSAALNTAMSKGKNLHDLSIGIIGAGNIGSKVESMCKSIGMNVLVNDPPLKRSTGDSKYLPIDDLLSCDIITMHVPLNKNGIDKTIHLFDEQRINKLKDGTIIINSSRGEVIDNNALCRLIEQKKFTVILDVWENEPDVMPELVEKTFLATPHVAGYSLEGKVNGTAIIFNKLCSYLNVQDGWLPDLNAPSEPVIHIAETMSAEAVLAYAITTVYDIRRDDKEMRKIISMNSSDVGKHFDLLRKNYPLRREFQNYTVVLPYSDRYTETILNAAGFKVKTKPH